jgi:hypothetical protein
MMRPLRLQLYNIVFYAIDASIGAIEVTVEGNFGAVKGQKRAVL